MKQYFAHSTAIYWIVTLVSWYASHHQTLGNSQPWCRCVNTRLQDCFCYSFVERATDTRAASTVSRELNQHLIHSVNKKKQWKDWFTCNIIMVHTDVPWSYISHINMKVVVGGSQYTTQHRAHVMIHTMCMHACKATLWCGGTYRSADTLRWWSHQLSNQRTADMWGVDSDLWF